VIALLGAGFPRRPVTGHDRRQLVRVRDNAPVDWFVKGKQTGLVRKELPYGDVLLAVLGEFRPVAADALLVVEPAAGVGDGQRHRRQTLGGRVDEDHGVRLPRFARLLVADAAPEVDHFLAAVIDAARAAQLMPSSEVLDERLAHRLEAGTDVPLDFQESRRPIAHHPGAGSEAILSPGSGWRGGECHVASVCIRHACVAEGQTADNPEVEPRCSEAHAPRWRRSPTDEESFSANTSALTRCHCRVASGRLGACRTCAFYVRRSRSWHCTPAPQPSRVSPSRGARSAQKGP